MTTRDSQPTTVQFDDEEDGDDSRKHAVVYQCQLNWDDLVATATADVRYCTNCAQRVFAVRDRSGLERAIAESHCVRIETKRRGNFFGVPSYDYMTLSRLNWDE